MDNQTPMILNGHSKKKLIDELRMSWNGEKYQEVLDELFKSYITTDFYCDKTEEERKDFVYFTNQLKNLVEKVDQEIHS